MKFKRHGFVFQLDEADALRYVGVSLYVSTSGYLRVLGRDWSGDRYVHRDLMKPKRGMYVDHINGDKLDNRRANLRVCTPCESAMNVGIKSDNTSGVRGVYWNKERLKWQAQIRVKKSTISLGRFVNLEEAIKVRRAAEREYHGEFSAALCRGV